MRLAEERPLLLVEDDPQDTELFLLACRELGFESRVVCLPDATSAWRMLSDAKNAPEYPRSLPAVAVIDLRMPGMSGQEFIQAVRADERLKPLPLVVLTSSQEPQDITACYYLGVNGYVVKPVEFVRFLRAIQWLVRFWLQTNEPLR